MSKCALCPEEADVYGALCHKCLDAAKGGLMGMTGEKMTDHAELNERAARLMRWSRSVAGDGASEGVSWLDADGRQTYWAVGDKAWNPAGNYNHFAEVLRSEAVRTHPDTGFNRGNYWCEAFIDLPAALEALLDVVEADRREGK